MLEGGVRELPPVLASKSLHPYLDAELTACSLSPIEYRLLEDAPRLERALGDLRSFSSELPRALGYCAQRISRGKYLLVPRLLAGFESPTGRHDRGNSRMEVIASPLGISAPHSRYPLRLRGIGGETAHQTTKMR